MLSVRERRLCVSSTANQVIASSMKRSSAQALRAGQQPEQILREHGGLIGKYRPIVNGDKPGQKPNGTQSLVPLLRGFGIFTSGARVVNSKG